MTDSYVQVPPNDDGAKMDMEELTVGVNTVERQRMQVAGSSATQIAPVDIKYGLRVDTGRQIIASGSITRPANTTTYAAGDGVAGSSSSGTAAAITFAVGSTSGGFGAIMGANLIDNSNQGTKGLFELWLFSGSSAPASPADNSAFAPSSGEVVDLVGVIPFNAPYIGNASSSGTGGGNTVYPSPSLSQPFKCNAATSNIFGLLVVRNAYIPISSEIFTIALQVRQD